MATRPTRHKRQNHHDEQNCVSLVVAHDQLRFCRTTPAGSRAAHLANFLIRLRLLGNAVHASHVDTTRCGRLLPESSLSNRTCDVLELAFRSTSVATFRPAAFSPFRKLVTSNSYHFPVMPVIAALASAVAALDGRLFHVSVASFQLVLTE